MRKRHVVFLVRLLLDGLIACAIVLIVVLWKEVL